MILCLFLDIIILCLIAGKLISTCPNTDHDGLKRSVDTVHYVIDWILGGSMANL